MMPTLTRKGKKARKKKIKTLKTSDDYIVKLKRALITPLTERGFFIWVIFLSFCIIMEIGNIFISKRRWDNFAQKTGSESEWLL